jgi:hypothetical protein
MFIWATITQIIALKDEVAGTFKYKIVKQFFMHFTRNTVTTNFVEWKFGISRRGRRKHW